MRIMLLLLIIMSAVSCSRQPFVEMKVDLDQVGTDCSKRAASFKMTADFGGERCEFEKCLPAGYKGESVVAERKGDTVVVNFKATTGASALYHVVLDIDTYPTYRYVAIDGETYTIGRTSE